MIVCHYCEKNPEVEPVGPGGQWTCKDCRYLAYKKPKPRSPGSSPVRKAPTPPEE